MNQESRRIGEKHRKAAVLLTVNAVFVVVLIASLVIPSKGKKILFSNADISMYNDLDSIPVLGAITNDRTAEIRFHLYDEKLYGICLYFYVGGVENLSEHAEGRLVCTLKSKEAAVARTEVSVKELAALKSKESLNAKELVFDCGEALSGEYTLLIEGEEIPADIRVALYANKNTERHLDYVNAGYDKYDGILYSVEAVTKEHPFIWSAALLLALSFLFSCIIYMNDGGKN